MRAECQCGHLSVELPGPTPAVVACHCTARQRRSGSPFGVLVYYPADQFIIADEVQRFERLTDEDNTFETFFCPTCGSTAYARASRHPPIIRVTVVSIADPDFQPPVRSVWEQTMPSSRTPP